MKQAVLIVACLFTLLLLGSCQTKEPNNMTNNKQETVTFINRVKEADVWILPDTQANRKTTLWGTATAAKVKTDESREAPLPEPGDDGLYLFRMIDADGFYYSANGVKLQANWSVTIRADDPHTVTLEVTDETGTLQNTYAVFSAKL